MEMHNNTHQENAACSSSPRRQKGPAVVPGREQPRTGGQTNKGASDVWRVVAGVGQLAHQD